MESTGSWARCGVWMVSVSALIGICACSKKADSTGTPSTDASSTTSSPAASSATDATRATGPTETVTSPLDVTGTVLRESKDVLVDGVTEKWRLEWQRPPVPTCFDESWTTCPCAGFAFAEKGTLHLVRERAGATAEHLDLSNLFDDKDARLRRFAPLPSDKGKPKPDYAAIESRPLAAIMAFGDYDHDGRATEFLFTIGSEPCGHVQTIVVGISKATPKLHAFGTVDTPNSPLVLETASDWERVRAAKPSTDVSVVLSACGDNGVEAETKLVVTAVEGGGLHTIKKERKCR